ncbi:MAG: peptide chain release factor N(5)-glutamine methyltransferase [Candidatus Buchananbacteria bacterium]|nr:peptide chain release factor N(5)-glutamine methyltransferase [Candidatus Buchananbacteria bacterium]
MTIKKMISTYSQKLNSFSPVLDIEILLAKTLNKNKEYLYTYPDKKLTDKQLAKFEKLFKRRSKGEPIAYILGYQEFFNLKFNVNQHVLIPRPETEILVEAVIKYISNLKSSTSILDIGVGSGAVIISLAKNIKNAQLYGTDVSAKALNIAKQNAKTHQAKIKFYQGNLLEQIPPKLKSQYSNLIITANLPYLDKQEKNLLPFSSTTSLKFEPKIAWDGGTDGLNYFRKFFTQIDDLKLKPKAIFLEIGHQQATAIKKLIPLSLAKYSLLIKKDLCGFERVLIIKQ